MSWEIPAPELCPQCKSVMRIVEGSDGKQYQCTRRDCNFSKLVADEPKD